MRFGLSVPPFTDPAAVVALATRAEASGWDGFFLWDHLSWDGAVDAHDPWVLLGAIAQETERVRLGTMVTPLSRRRPQLVAKHLTTLDHLSGGRAILGVGPRRPAGPRLLRLRRRAVLPGACGDHRRSADRARRPAGRRSGLPPRQPPRRRGVGASAPGAAATDPDLGRGPGAAHSAAGAGQAVGRLRPDRRPLPVPRRPGGVRRRAPRATGGTSSRSGHPAYRRRSSRPSASPG